MQEQTWNESLFESLQHAAGEQALYDARRCLERQRLWNSNADDKVERRKRNLLKLNTWPIDSSKAEYLLLAPVDRIDFVEVLELYKDMERSDAKKRVALDYFIKN